MMHLWILALMLSCIDLFDTNVSHVKNRPVTHTSTFACSTSQSSNQKSRAIRINIHIHNGICSKTFYGWIQHDTTNSPQICPYVSVFVCLSFYVTVRLCIWFLKVSWIASVPFVVAAVSWPPFVHNAVSLYYQCFACSQQACNTYIDICMHHFTKQQPKVQSYTY
jgi:hypothetical protein